MGGPGEDVVAGDGSGAESVVGELDGCGAVVALVVDGDVESERVVGASGLDAGGVGGGVGPDGGVAVDGVDGR
ncbi:MAG: hypothetical protein U5R31_03120 [Acidimicrobiia bacterium]|nr:hypothetical protein [Acidimicrobiia bacterium]